MMVLILLKTLSRQRQCLMGKKQSCIQYRPNLIKRNVNTFIPFEFKSRNEVVKATQLQCILVSQDPKQFMIGSVPFSFAARDAASKAKANIQDGPVLVITKLQFK